ncbi:MAG: M28 family peptidase, partial [Bacteroidota bacterium]
VDQVDSTRLRQDLEFIAQERTVVTALPHLQAVKDTIETLFSEFGLQASRQAKPLAGTYTMENIIGRKSGLFSPEKTYLLGAHFDGVAGTDAADDNGSGTVGYLEVARILSQYEFANSLQFMGFDQEEVGLLGSIEYVLNGIQPWESIEGMINFEMIGYYDPAPNTQQLPPGFDLLFPQLYNEVAADGFRGNFLINVANVASNPLRLTFDSCAQAYVPELLVRSLAAPGNSELAPDLRRSDHAPFWDNGNQALMITDGAEYRNPFYHSPADSIGTLNFTFMHQIVKAAVATLATMAKPLHADVSITEIEGGVIDAMPPIMGNCGLSYQQSGSDLRLSLAHPNCRNRDWKLELYNLQGQLIHQQIWPQAVSTLDLASQALSPGVYLWQLSGEGESFGKKILLH